jgi:large subunit ribosomal protein L3
MLDAMLGKKIGMTQVYDEAGVIHPVTVIELGPCTVMQVKSREKDGYVALRLGFQDKRRKSATRPERALAEKIQSEPKRFIREVRLDEAGDRKPGAVLTAAELEGAKVVDVVGTSKGKGFQGVVKRHHFHGHPASHGTSKVHRRPGSIGPGSEIGHVIKGRRMAGHMGNVRRTVKNLSVVRLDPEKNLLLVQGGIPGPNGGFVLVRVVRREEAKKEAKEGKETKETKS